MLNDPVGGACEFKPEAQPVSRFRIRKAAAAMPRRTRPGAAAKSRHSLFLCGCGAFRRTERRQLADVVRGADNPPFATDAVQAPEREPA